MGIDAVAHESARLLDIESDSAQFGTTTQSTNGTGSLFFTDTSLLMFSA
jgi:hypothetical protein